MNTRPAYVHIAKNRRMVKGRKVLVADHGCALRNDYVDIGNARIRDRTDRADVANKRRPDSQRTMPGLLPAVAGSAHAQLLML